MSRIIKIETEQNLESKYDLVVYGIYEGGKMSKLSSTFSEQSSDYLTGAFNSEKNVGKDKKRINCYENGKSKQICLYGLGKFKNSDHTRSLAAGVVKYANSLTHQHFKGNIMDSVCKTLHKPLEGWKNESLRREVAPPSVWRYLFCCKMMLQIESG